MHDNLQRQNRCRAVAGAAGAALIPGRAPGRAGPGQGKGSLPMGWDRGSFPQTTLGFCEHELIDKSKMCRPGQWRKPQDKDLHCSARGVRGEQLLLLHSTEFRLVHNEQGPLQWHTLPRMSDSMVSHSLKSINEGIPQLQHLGAKASLPVLGREPSPSCCSCPGEQSGCELPAAPPNTPAELLTPPGNCNLQLIPGHLMSNYLPHSLFS